MFESLLWRSLQKKQRPIKSSPINLCKWICIQHIDKQNNLRLTFRDPLYCWRDVWVESVITLTSVYPFITYLNLLQSTVDACEIWGEIPPQSSTSSTVKHFQSWKTIIFLEGTTIVCPSPEFYLKSPILWWNFNLEIWNRICGCSWYLIARATDLYNSRTRPECSDRYIWCVGLR